MFKIRRVPPEVVRRNARVQAVARPPLASVSPNNGNKPWTDEECHRIVQEGRPKDKILAQVLGRSPDAIRWKRKQLMANPAMLARVMAVPIPPIQTKPEIVQPPTIGRCVIRATCMKVKVPYDGDPSMIWELLEQHQPHHDRGFKVGAKGEVLSFGLCEIFSINLGSRQAEVRPIQNGQIRIVSIDDARRAVLDRARARTIR